MGLRTFFSKSKAESIEINGIKYSAPKDGICSVRVEDGKVYVNGQEATKEIIENEKVPAKSTNYGVFFDEFNVTFNGVKNEDNYVEADVDTVNIDVNNYKVDDTMDLNIESHGDIKVKGNVRGSISTTEGDVTIEGNLILEKGLVQGENINVTENIICPNRDEEVARIRIGEGDLTIGKDCVGNIDFDSSKTNVIEVHGNFIGSMLDKNNIRDDGYADIYIDGKAVGNIHTNTCGEISVGVKD